MIDRAVIESDTAKPRVDAWIAFACSGDPSTESLPWERYDPVERTQMMLGPNRRVEHGWRAAERAVWDGVV